MSELPEGWTSTALKDVLEDVQSGFASGEKGVEGGLKHLRMNNIGVDGKLNLDLLRTVPVTLASERHYLSKGDILFCTTNSAKLVGKCCSFELDEQFAFSNHLTKLRVSEAVIGMFLLHYLWLLWKQGEFEHKCKHWVNQSTLPKDELLQTKILLPPLNEQRRIVARLEELLSRVDAAQARLATIPRILKRFRKSVLAAACSGKLTVDWREENPETEFSCQLIDHINQHRKLKTWVEVIEADERPDEDLPSTWTWVRFGSVIGELRNGVSVRPNTEPPGTPMLRINAARSGKVDLGEIRYLPSGKDFLPLYSLQERDLLFTRYNGSLELLGVCGMVRQLNGNVMLYPDKLMRVRFDHELLLPEYVEVFFQSPTVHERVIAKSKSSAGQNGVSGSDIKSQAFALPPFREQQEVVRRVEALFKTADALEARYRTAKAHVDKLTQSILARAFRGELVTTEAELARREERDYEPASVLLERIRQERAEQRAPKQSPTKRTSRSKKIAQTQELFA